MVGGHLPPVTAIFPEANAGAVGSSLLRLSLSVFFLSAARVCLCLCLCLCAVAVAHVRVSAVFLLAFHHGGHPLVPSISDPFNFNFLLSTFCFLLSVSVCLRFA
jgi:hypothetical protein